MKRSALLAPIAAIGIALAACSGGDDAQATHAAPEQHQSRHAHASTSSAPATSTSAEPEGDTTGPDTLTVPTDLTGMTLGEAKERLADLGFSNVVVAGGQVTNGDPVRSVPQAGKDIAADAEVVVLGETPQPAQPARPAQPAPEQPQQQRQQQGQGPTADTETGCGQRAVNRGVFNPACSEYQGYLDPGTRAGRDPTSGEIQFKHGCEQGYIPQSECSQYRWW